MAKTLTGQQIDMVLVNALYTAARTYEECAKTFWNMPPLVAQFEKQANDARALAEEFEQAEVVTITYA